ncbi:MAG TPA: hypothetical protein VKV06_00720 [Acidimicrobiales bacterium]|nr:hypothetical protein [Acidimicrobiales bacterium]
MNGIRRRLATLATLVGRAGGLATGEVALLLAGRTRMAVPLTTSPRAVLAWAQARPPVEVVVAIVRAGGLLVGAYLLAVVALAIVGQVAGHRPTCRLAGRLLPAAAGRLLLLGAGAGVVSAVLAPAAGAAPAATPTLAGAAPPTAAAAPTLARATPPASATAPTLAQAPAPTLAGAAPPVRGAPTLARAAPANAPHTAAHPPAPLLRRVGGTSRPRLIRRTPPQPARDTARPAAPEVTSSVVTRAHWVEVRPGDSFWSIATAELTAARGRTPDVAEIAPYWSRLVAANHDHLPVPGQPDLLYPGDRVRVPPVPPVPPKRP